jgi:hypothetical protein
MRSYPSHPSTHLPKKPIAINLPVRPLLVQDTMSTVPAANRLAALKRDVLVAVTAFVMHGAGVCVDGGSVLRAGGRVGVVLLGRHFGRVCLRVGGCW